MVPWHLGGLHPYETVLTLLLAFGPFVVLAVVVWRRRGEEDREAERVPDQDAGQRDR